MPRRKDPLKERHFDFLQKADNAGKLFAQLIGGLAGLQFGYQIAESFTPLELNYIPKIVSIAVGLLGFIIVNKVTRNIGKIKKQ